MLSFGFIAATLIASLIMLNGSTPKKEKATCCIKTSKECTGEIESVPPPKTTLENLSHHFIMIPAFFN